MTALAALLALGLGGVELRIQPGAVRPGDVVLVEVRGAASPPEGRLGDAELVFLPLGDGAHVALAGLSVEHQRALLPVEVVVGRDGAKERLEGTVEVLPAAFRKRKLTVSKRFTSPTKKQRQQAEADQRAFSEAFDRDFEPWTFDAGFAWPRRAEVTAPFGDLRLLNGKKKSQHFGLDLDGDTGAPIAAANDGEVVLVRECFASGNTVIVHHGGRLFTTYFHLTRFAVKPGEPVKRGQLLGTVGKTGRVTGPHLHFGVKLDGRWVNPEALLALDWPQVSGRSTSERASPGTP